MDPSITWTISGPVLGGMIALLTNAVILTKFVWETKRSQKRVEEKVDPVGNGFVTDTKKSLKDIDKALEDIDSSVRELTRKFMAHQEYHLSHDRKR